MNLINFVLVGDSVLAGMASSPAARDDLPRDPTLLMQHRTLMATGLFICILLALLLVI